MMRKPSSSEGGFRKDRKGHCQHISQKSQSVSQIEKTVPHPPARHCSSICLRRRLCKRDRRKRSFPTSTNQLLVGGTERESEIFPAVDVSSLLIAHIISEWGGAAHGEEMGFLLRAIKWPNPPLRVVVVDQRLYPLLPEFIVDKQLAAAELHETCMYCVRVWWIDPSREREEQATRCPFQCTKLAPRVSTNVTFFVNRINDL